MSDKGWNTIESIGIALVIATSICAVILGISYMLYKTGTDTHVYDMALVEKCAVEYRFENNIHWVYKEYCGGTVHERVQVVAVQTTVNQTQTQTKK